MRFSTSHSPFPEALLKCDHVLNIIENDIDTVALKAAVAQAAFSATVSMSSVRDIENVVTL